MSFTSYAMKSEFPWIACSIYSFWLPDSIIWATIKLPCSSTVLNWSTYALMIPQISPNSGFSDKVDESRFEISIIELKYSANIPVTGSFYLITGLDKRLAIIFSLGGAGVDEGFLGGDDKSYLLFLFTFGTGDLLNFFSSIGNVTYFYSKRSLYADWKSWKGPSACRGQFFPQSDKHRSNTFKNSIPYFSSLFLHLKILAPRF